MGLPASNYATFKSLLTQIVSDASCSEDNDGICTLPNACNTYDQLKNYQFKMNFTSAVSGYYMRVPLATFAQVSSSGQCELQITDLNYTETSVVLGGMFFQEFFGVFQNNYLNVFDITQTASIYVSKNAISNAYVGNQVIPSGNNPFDSGSSLGPWVIAFISVGAFIVLLFIAVLLFCCCRKNKEQDSQNVVYGADMQNDEQKLINSDN
jgi:hypothetical protein